jgi:hypothetical protein
MTKQLIDLQNQLIENNMYVTILVYIIRKYPS